MKKKAHLCTSFSWNIFIGCNFGAMSGSWVVEWAIMPADHESLISAKIVKVFVTVAQVRQWSFGQRQTIKIAWGMKQTRPIWNASVYKDEVWVEMWLKSQMERKILKLLKYENTSRLKENFCHQPLSPPPHLCSHRAPASVSFPHVSSLWVGSNVHCWASWAVPTSLNPVHVSPSSSAFMEVSLGVTSNTVQVRGLLCIHVLQSPL